MKEMNLNLAITFLIGIGVGLGLVVYLRREKDGTAGQGPVDTFSTDLKCTLSNNLEQYSKDIRKFLLYSRYAIETNTTEREDRPNAILAPSEWPDGTKSEGIAKIICEYVSKKYDFNINIERSSVVETIKTAEFTIEKLEERNIINVLKEKELISSKRYETIIKAIDEHISGTKSD